MRDRLELKFQEILQDIGLAFKVEPTISVDTPVPDKNGRWVKTKTVPDFLVKNGNLNCYVEVTHSLRATSHKIAQRRVVNKAGVENYKVLSGADIEAFNRIDPAKWREYLLRKLKIRK